MLDSCRLRSMERGREPFAKPTKDSRGQGHRATVTISKMNLKQTKAARMQGGSKGEATHFTILPNTNLCAKDFCVVCRKKIPV